MLRAYEHGTIVGPKVSTPSKPSPPRRRHNKDRREREYLTPPEVETLMQTARQRKRNGHRDATMILVAYQHGLRAAELVAMTWAQVEFEQKVLHVSRRKNGVRSVHPMTGEEMRALRRLYREQQARGRVLKSDQVFQTEQGVPITEAGFRKMLARVGEASPLSSLYPHPHALRHSCGYKLANDGRDTRSLQLYLGHRNIQHTTRYTELASNRFEGWWE